MNTKKLLAGAALVTLSAGLASTAKAASDTGVISAVVVSPITVASTTALKFGSFSVTAAGSFPVSAGGVRGAGSGSVDIGAAYQAGGFSITADTRAMTVTVSPTATINHTVTATKTMKVTAINFDCNSANWAVKATAVKTATCSLGASPGIVKTGGTINYGLGQTPGVYTGSYTLTASYN